MPRDKKESVVFDLVDDSGSADAADVGPDAGGGPGPRFLSRLPRPSRRTWVIAAVVVAAMAVTAASVDLVRDHRRAELMRTSSVGVASLADPPEETWTVPFDVPAGRYSDAHLGQQLVVMDGVLVLPPTSTPGYPVDSEAGVFEALPRFTGIVAIEPGSGEVAWRVPVDEHPECGPSGYDASISTEVLVCVHGPDDDRQVLVITPDGATRSRPLDLAEGESVFPGPDGMVVRTVRTGDPIGYLACDESRNCPPRILDQGRSLRVTAEDAGTGAERWTSTIEFDPTISDSCQTWPATADPSDEPVTDPDLTTVNVGAESVSVGGCGMAATLSVDGARLDLAGDLVTSSQIWVTELGSGRFAVEGDAAETVVVNTAGEILRTVQGWMSSSPTAPDAPDDLWFVPRPSGVGFAAVREDGSEAWTVLEESRVALAARDVVVVNRGNRLVGLDRATGAEMWHWADDPRGLVNFRTLTDGETIAAQLLPQDGEGEGVLVAIDLGTGEELWEVPLTGGVVAVDGHLVEFTTDGVRGLG